MSLRGLQRSKIQKFFSKKPKFGLKSPARVVSVEHPTFLKHENKMWMRWLYLVGTPLNPYAPDPTIRVSDKVKTITNLDPDNLHKFITKKLRRLSLDSWLTRHTKVTSQMVRVYLMLYPNMKADFLAKLASLSLIVKLSANTRSFLKTTPRLRHIKTIRSFSRRGRPYLFLNSSPISNYRKNSRLHKFLRITRKSRYVRRRVKRKLRLKKRLFKAQKRKTRYRLRYYSGYRVEKLDISGIVLASKHLTIRKPYRGSQYLRLKTREVTYNPTCEYVELGLADQFTTELQSSLSQSSQKKITRKLVKVARSRRATGFPPLFRERFVLQYTMAGLIPNSESLAYIEKGESLNLTKNFNFRHNANFLKHHSPTKPLTPSTLWVYSRYKENLFISGVKDYLLSWASSAVSKSFVYINSKFNKGLRLATKTKKAFIMQNVGVFILNNSVFKKLKLKYKFRFKKLFFSFLFPNQLKKSLMDRKKRIIVSRYFLRRKLKSAKSLKFSFKIFKKKFRKFYNLQFPNLAYSTNYQTPHYFYSKPKDDILYKTDYLAKGLDYSFKFDEVFIRRVRFKPGYQRLWRQARTSIKEALSLTFRYQYRLTRYLSKFLKQTTHYMLSASEMSLERAVMYSRLLPDVKTLVIFIDTKRLYLNGKLATILYTNVAQNDLIQLIISNSFYILSRWMLNWSISRVKKFKRLVYKKGLAGKHRLTKTRKQKSRYTPLFIHNTRYDISDIKNYFEVDYMTLSVFVVYEPYFLTYQSINDLSDTRPTIYRLYNWKYIT